MELEEPQKPVFSCSYCHNIGACPKCWGRAAIEELYVQIHKLQAEVRSYKLKEIEIEAKEK